MDTTSNTTARRKEKISISETPAYAQSAPADRSALSAQSSSLLFTLNKRSNAMKTQSFFRRGMSAILALVLLAGMAFSQNLVIKNGSTFSGSGTINVKGNITTPSLTQDKTIGGTVNMTKTTGDQEIGTAGTNQTLTFGTLNVNTTGGTSTTTQVVSGIVTSTALSVANGTTLDVDTKTLTISGTSTLNASGSLNVTDASSVVNYNRADGVAQTVLGLNYAGTLNLSGATSAKSFTAAGSAATMTHAGGDLTVNQTWSVGTSGTFATIADITGSLSFDAGATGAKSITTVTNISTGSLTTNATSGALAITTLSGNAGSINATGAGGIGITTATNGSGTITASGGGVTIATLSGNSGTIQTTGAGGLSFTGAATNGGSITGATGSGAVAFGSTLANNAGASVTAGSGDVSFAGIVTNAATASIVGGANSLDFNANVDNSGAISLAATGSATMAGSFTTVGTLTLDVASNWTYDGAAQNIANATYGNLFTEGSGTKTAQGNIIVAGNFDNGGTGNLAITTDMDEFTLGVTGTRENTNGTLRFGGLTNGLSFGTTAASAGTVIYDGASPAVASQDVAAGSYYNLQFENNAAKNILNNTTVSSGNSVSLAANVTLNVVYTSGAMTTLNIGASGSGVGALTLLANSTLVNDGAVNVAGDLDNTGALTNNGTITVGY